MIATDPSVLDHIVKSAEFHPGSSDPKLVFTRIFSRIIEIMHTLAYSIFSEAYLGLGGLMQSKSLPVLTTHQAEIYTKQESSAPWIAAAATHMA